jgi:hypothetical protein
VRSRFVSCGLYLYIFEWPAALEDRDVTSYKSLQVVSSIKNQEKSRVLLASDFHLSIQGVFKHLKEGIGLWMEISPWIC